MSIDNVTIHQGYELPNGTNTLAHDVTRLINALTSVDSDVFLRPLASSSTYVGTTAIALNRASAAQALTGITSIDGSAASLTTSRTLWGQSFNGSANVTGSLTSVGNITGSGAISLTTAAASNLSLTSGTTGIVTLDSGTTGAINIGTGADTKTITIGSATGTVQLPTAVTKVGQTFLIQGGAGNVTFPTTPGTLLGSNDVGSVTSTMILNATIVNADISPSAAIAGTKISPDFGSQNVTTTGTSTAASFIPSSATVPTNGLYLSAANAVALSTNSTGRLFIDSSGNASLNRATPASLGANYTTLTLRGKDNDFGGGIIFESLDASDRTFFYGDVGAFYAITQDARPFILGTNAFERMRITSAGTVNIVGAGTAGSTQAVSFNGSAPVNSLVLDSSGKLGVGTNAPNAPLEVVGSTDADQLRITQSGTYYRVGRVGASGLLQFYGSQSGFNGYIFGGVDGEFFRINANGRVGIGVSVPSYQLQLSTDSAGKPSTNTWTIVSDERIKEDIELADLDLCYEAIKTIPLKRYKWRDDVYSNEQVTDRRKLGWIAQDVETVFPKAVSIHEFKYNQVFEEIIIPAVEEEVDAEGNIITSAQPECTERGKLISEDVIEDCKDLNADQIYAAMYGAIQKLIAKVETLETEVAQLKD